MRGVERNTGVYAAAANTAESNITAEMFTFGADRRAGRRAPCRGAL